MQELINTFLTDGRPVSWTLYGSGHINETWLVQTDRSCRYILQKVNTSVFPDAAGLMNNILLVTEHLRKKDPAPGHVLNLIPTKNGDWYILRPGNVLWRMYDYVSGGICLERAENPEEFRLSGKAFGLFQRQMADFPAEQLVEVIPGFHDTPGRYAAFHRVLKEDPVNRAASVRAEIDFFLDREKDAGLLMMLHREGKLPLRVTHNDTKLNNVMLDERTREPLCILDLDTVMPGLVACDFGDSIRFGASTADEDEKDLEKVHLDLTLYEAFARGFIGACGTALTEDELDTLPDGAWMMTLENGVRFLADYLAGDTYYHIERPEHNLDRARTQIALLREMERQKQKIREILRQVRTEEIPSS